MFKPSKFQQAVFDFIQSGSGNALIEAVAGSGKTTTIVQALSLIPTDKSVVFLAFNKKIAEELKVRVPSHVSAMTLNGLGHRAWSNFAGRNIKLDGSKTREVMKEFQENYEKDLWDALYMPVRKLVGLAKAEGIVPENMGLQGLAPDTQETWDSLIDHHDIQFVDKSEKASPEREGKARKMAIELARLVLSRSIELGKEVIDFDDQLYLTVIHDVPMYQYDWVFTDESQDVSAIQRALITKAVKRIGRAVFVGDPRQAIYGFRGADSESMENIAKQFNCTRLPLSVSYRCPRNIVAEAQTFVSHILPHESAPEGEVQDLGEYNDKTEFKPGELLVCRSNAPLIRLAYKLIRRRVPVKVMGRDIGAGLITLIEKLNAKGVDKLVEKVNEWHARESARRLKKDPEADLSDIDDKRDVIEIFATEAGAVTVPGVISAIENLFADKSGDAKAIDPKVVNLATIHKSKGLEAEVVYFLDSWMLPSKYAKKPHQQIQESNLSYVAITRAKQILRYIDSPKPKQGDK